MEKFKTVKQVANALKEDGYKFKHINNEGKSVYWDCDGKVAHVDLKSRTIDYRGMIQ